MLITPGSRRLKKVKRKPEKDPGLNGARTHDHAIGRCTAGTPGCF